MMNRRQALGRLAAIMTAGSMGITKVLSAAETTRSLVEPADRAASPNAAVTIAHITDIHLYPKMQAEKWFAECLHHVQENPLKPQLIINTGDCVMDTLAQTRAEADALWKLWGDTLKRENSMAIRHTLGNHDHWGLALGDDNPLSRDPYYGKRLALEALGMARGYYSFDLGAWHLIALDSILPTKGQKGTGWIAGLDKEQMAWLKKDLQDAPATRPVLIYSHVPIVQICTLLNLKPEENEHYVLNSHKMHSDSNSLLALFAKHPNVKLCLSGHMHLRDRVELEGVTYICDGAVSGDWWKGPRQGFPPGYSTVTLKPDSTFDVNYTAYGWAPEAQG